MISEEQIDLLIERLVNRMQKANTYFLKNIGESIKKIRSLKPSQAQQLVQILKYGGNYDEIVREIRKYADLNVRDIDNIFNAYAKKDHRFYKQFYEYRNIPFVPYEQNLALQTQTMALANVVKRQIYDITRANVLGYTITDESGKVLFRGLKDTYNELLDTALVNVGTGKETFDRAMSKILKDIGESGLKTVDYVSGRSVRLDSALRMNLQSGLRELHNENQRIAGDEFGYNGVEVTHHPNAAPDHIDTVDGKQFALIDKIEEQIASGEEKTIKKEDIRGNQVKIKGKWYDDFDAINNSLIRHVSELNCRHTIFPIIVGVSKPEYTQEQLDEDKYQNMMGFDFDGKHYTLYEGTQLQRELERKIREQKDTQILGKSSGNKDLIASSQQKITQLINKYNELSKISGLKPKMNRLRVPTYKRVAIK